MDRRSFLVSAAACAAGSSAFSASMLASPQRSKKILVIGGTNFLGPAVVEAALIAGHDVTLLNRGVTNPHIFPHLEHLVGYRSVDPADQNLTAISGRRWDAVIDVWPFEPEMVQYTAQMLRDRTDHYVYVSSIAAYDGRNFERPGLTESASLNSNAGTARPYARGKAESERRLESILRDKLTVVRPGAITGYRDDGAVSAHIWLVRAQSGGQHIGPGDGTDPVQFVDVKDVAEFVISAIDQRRFGAFNLARKPMLFSDFLSACKVVTHADVEFIWIERNFLIANGLIPGPTFPYLASLEHRGAEQISCQKAIDASWKPRDFEATARDCLLWYYELKAAQMSDEYSRRDPLLPSKESEVLRLWASRVARAS